MDPKHEQTTDEAARRRARGSKKPDTNPQAEMKIHKAEDDVLDVIQSVESQLGALRKAHEEHRTAMAEISKRRLDLEEQAIELEGRETELTSREVELAEMRQDFENREVNLVQRAGGLEQRESKLASHAELLEQQEADLESKGKELERKISELDAQLAGLSKRKTELEAIEADAREKLAREDKAAAELKKATQELAQSKSAIEQSKSQLAKLKSTLESSQSDLEHSEQELADSKTKLADSVAALGKMSDAYNETKVSFEKLREEHNKAIEDFKASDSKLRGREIELSQRSQTLEDLADKAGAIEHELNSTRERYSKEVQELSEQLEKEQQVSYELRARVEEMEQSSEQAISASSKQVTELKTKLYKASSELESMRQAAQDLGKESDGQVVQLTSELEQSKSLAEMLREQVNEIAKSADEELTSERERVADLESTIEQLSTQLKDANAQRDSIKGELDAKPDIDPGAQEELQAKITASEKAAAESSAKLDEAKAALSSLESEIASRDDLVEKANTRIKELEEQSSSLFETVEELNEKLENATDSPSIEVDEWNQSRRSRLQRMRKVLAGDAEKIRRATEALRGRYDQCEQVLTKRAELAQAYEAIASAQRKYEKREVRSGVFLGLIGLAAITLVIAGTSWFVAGRVAPGMYAAKVTMAAASGDSKISELEMEQWEVYITQLTSDPRFLEVAADRMKRRGIGEFAVPGDLAKEMDASLDVASAMPGTVVMEYRGVGSERSGRILDTFAVALSSAANNARARRADSAMTVMEESVVVGTEPLDTRRIEMAGMIFGGGMLTTLILGGVIWKRLSAAKARFERDSRLEGLLDENQWQMPA